MKIVNLVKSEFVKNYSIKRFLIIILLLIASSLFLIGTINSSKDEAYEGKDPIEYNIDFVQKYIDYHNKKEEKTFKDNYILNFYKNELEYLNLIKDKGIKSFHDWRASTIHDDLIPLINQNYLIEQIKISPNDPYIVESCANEDSELYDSDKIYNLCVNYSLEELDTLYENNNIQIKEYEKLLKKDRYYLYLEYQVQHNKIEKNKFVELLIDKKVEENTEFLGLNYLQYQTLEENANLEIPSLEGDKVINGMDYEVHVKHQTKLKNDATQNREILFYSTEKEIKHDISYQYYDNISEDITYINTKLKVNQVFHLSVVVMLIVGITSSGIISNEHNKGTIKNIITAPVRRWKILLSKFIYLILDTYIIWLLGLLIISICAGIKYGFTDLFTPQLLYTGSKVIEVNYYLYLIKNIFFASIPVICFLSILLFLSTISLSTSLTVGVTVSLGVIAPFMWLLSMTGNFKYIVYTPIWYFDYGFIFNNSTRYIESLRHIYYQPVTGIWICLIVSIILYLVSNLVYVKRDIKN